MNQTRIAELRRTKGWTQERLAEASGVTARTIQRLEGGNDASLETLSVVAKALEVPVRDLFTEVDAPSFQTSVDGLDTRTEDEQQRRDAATRGWSQLYSAVGIAVTLGTIALISVDVLPGVGIFLIPIWWVGGRLLLEFLLTTAIDPRLDAKYPLSRPSARGRAARRA